MKKTLLCCVLLSALGGCGGDDAPADPATARRSVSELLPPLLDDSGDAFEAAGAAAAVDGYRGSMTALNDTFSALPFRFPLSDAESLARKLAPQTRDESLGAAAARWIVEHVLTDATYEGDGVFLVRGASVCPVEEGLGGTTAPADDCVRTIDAAQLRVRVTRAGGGVDLTLLVGPTRAEPLVLGLRRESIDLDVDLAEAREALLHLAAVAGADLELPSVMRGRVALTLTRKGPAHVELALAVRAPIAIEGATREGALALTVAARDPLARLVLDGQTGHHGLDLDVGPIALSAPWHLLAPDSRARGTLVVDWRGLTARIAVDGDGGSLTATGVSLGDGPSTVKLDGKTLLAVDLARLSLEVVPRAAGLPRFVFDPGLQLAVTLGLAPLAAAGDDVAAWARDEVIQVRAGRELQPLPRALQAVKGTLSITAVKAGASVTVNEGQCLLGSPVGAAEHPLIGAFAAGACP